MENYRVIRALGQGTWGVVQLAEQIGTGRKVALKKIKSSTVEEGANFTALREIKILREFKHEHIIDLMDVIITQDDAICLVFEVAATDLKKILDNRSIPISLADTKRHLLSLMKAVAACHARWILHRDLKPDNMLYLADGTMKLTDFGLARFYGTPNVRLSPNPITLWYKPPEMLLGATQYCSAVDMWSVGCIFAELLLRRPFLPGKSTMETGVEGQMQSDLSQLEEIFRVFGTPTDANWPNHMTLPRPTMGLLWEDCAPIPFDEIFNAAPRDALSLLRSMLTLDPNKRFSAEQCLIHPYFDNSPAPTPKESLILSTEP